MKPPQTVESSIAAIRALKLPSREYEDALRRQKAEYEKAHAEHDKHGAVLQRWVGQTFRRALGSGYAVEVNRSRGYLLDWSYATGQSRHRVSVRPYIHIRIYLPHGRELWPSTNRSGGAHGDGRCTVELSYFPHAGEDLGEWAAKWIAWLKAAPAPGRPANLQVSP